MDEIKIEDIPEEELGEHSLDLSKTGEPEIPFQESPLEEDEDSKSTRFILITIGAVVLIIVLLFAFKTPYIQPVTTKAFVTTNQAHPSTETANKYMYNGIEFEKKDNFWHAGLKTSNTLYNVQFYYGPKEIESIPSKGWFGPAFQDNKVYVTFNPTDENLTFVALSIGQLDTHLIKTFQKSIEAACAVNETSACISRPLVNCENTNNTAVFYIKESDTPKITITDNCAIIEGKGWDLVKSTEALLMRMYNIIQK